MSMNVTRIAGVLAGIAAMSMTGCERETITPPIAEKKPETLEIHGDERIDEYFWLRERDNPKVIEYLEDENAYTDAMLADAAGLQARLLDEMKARIKDEDQTVPYRDGDYWYYKRFEPGKEYAIYCRRKGSLEAPEEILLDVNAIAGDHEYFAVRGFSVSPDHRIAAYGVDTRGRRFYDIHFLDLETGERLPDVIDAATPYYEFASDSRTIIYTKQHPDTLRWQYIYRYRLGDDENGHELVYEETDETYSSWVYKSLSGKFLYVASQSTLASDVRYLPADAPDADLQLFHPRGGEHEYYVSDGADRFYILSNDEAANFRLFEAPLDDTGRDAWTEVVAHRPDVLIEDFDAFAGHVVLTGKRQGLVSIEILDRETGKLTSLDFGEQTFDAEPGDNAEYDTQVFRYDYESLTTPDSVYDYDMVSGERTLVDEDEIVGDFDRDDYYSERLFATARDGTKIPVSIVYRKGIELDGSNPLLQYAYGSYGSSIEPTFYSPRLSLLDRGFVYAIAHIRGGSEMGREWYFDGRQLNKKNTFTDFIDVSKFLIDEGYTSPEHLHAMGGSAGGLLMGAVANMAPELYNGMTAEVPFVDVITTMLDASIPLTAGEWDEWGDPRDKEYYDYMLSYSPYDQVSAQDYPNMLVTTGLHDSQVQYWEPAKWVAKLRAMKTDDNLLLLKTDMKAGHSGKTGRYQSLEDYALMYGFHLYLEGIRE